MPTHDNIDNRNQKLGNQINCILDSEEEIKAKVNILEKRFRGAITQAIARELNALRRNGVTNQDLFNQMVQIYSQHNMRDRLNNNSLPTISYPIPIIICSEALV